MELLLLVLETYMDSFIILVWSKYAFVMQVLMAVNIKYSFTGDQQGIGIKPDSGEEKKNISEQLRLYTYFHIPPSHTLTPHRQSPLSLHSKMTGSPLLRTAESHNHPSPKCPTHTSTSLEMPGNPLIRTEVSIMTQEGRFKV